MKVLIIAPLHDFPTILSNQAVSSLVQFLNAHTIPYDLLCGITATRPTIELYIKTNKYNGVFYYGHGEEDRLGDWLMPLIGLIDTNNIHLFEDTIVYTMACLSGKELARVAIKKGVRSYYGHTIRYFAFVKKIGLKYDFLHDWVELVNLIPKRLILGDSTGIAMIKYEKLANELYSRYVHLDNETNRELLYKNALHLTLYGDRGTKLKF